MNHLAQANRLPELAAPYFDDDDIPEVEDTEEFLDEEDDEDYRELNFDDE